MKNREDQITAELPIDLGDGLILRWGTDEDIDDLAKFNIRVLSDNPDEPEEFIGYWTKDLMSGIHPTTSAKDFTIVVDGNKQDKIVSSLCLISQVWTYDGVRLPVGRIELVGTDAEYRRRGLIRQQMEVIHALSASRGEIMQGITGIPWYYRMFGYEMTINLDGGRPFYWIRAGNDKKVEKEPYTVREAVAADIPILETLYQQNNRDSLLVQQRTDAIWRYGIEGAHTESIDSLNVNLVIDDQDQVVAYFTYFAWGASLNVREVGVLPGHSYRAISLFITRYLKGRAEKLNEKRKKKITRVSFYLGEKHAVYAALGSQLDQLRGPYAWYIRVPDIRDLLARITPVLEKRLENSVMAGHSGNLRINLYTDHIQLTFENGRLQSIATFEPKFMHDGDVLFPNLTFLKVLFGYRSFKEVDTANADCFASGPEPAILIDILFPRHPSDIKAL